MQGRSFSAGEVDKGKSAQIPGRFKRSIDIRLDEPQKHPTQFCHSCKNILTKKVWQSNLYDWEDHEENCVITTPKVKLKWEGHQQHRIKQRIAPLPITNDDNLVTDILPEFQCLSNLLFVALTSVRHAAVSG